MRLGLGENLSGYESMKDFVMSLEKPRCDATLFAASINWDLAGRKLAGTQPYQWLFFLAGV
jgi:hypothetical protein